MPVRDSVSSDSSLPSTAIVSGSVCAGEVVGRGGGGRGGDGRECYSSAIKLIDSWSASLIEWWQAYSLLLPGPWEPKGVALRTWDGRRVSSFVHCDEQQRQQDSLVRDPLPTVGHCGKSNFKGVSTALVCFTCSALHSQQACVLAVVYVCVSNLLWPPHSPIAAQKASPDNFTKGIVFKRFESIWGTEITKPDEITSFILFCLFLINALRFLSG